MSGPKTRIKKPTNIQKSYLKTPYQLKVFDMGAYKFYDIIVEESGEWRKAWHKWYDENQDTDDQDDPHGFEEGYGVKTSARYLGEKEDPKTFADELINDDINEDNLKWGPVLVVKDATKENTFVLFGVMSC